MIEIQIRVIENSHKSPIFDLSEDSRKYLTQKVLLRLSPRIDSNLRRKKRKLRKSFRFLIESAVAQFYLEVLPIEFKEAIERRCDLLELNKFQLSANRLGFVSYTQLSENEERVARGTLLSLQCLDQLGLIELWGGVSRQSAIDACLAYSLRLHGAPNPDRGQLTRFMHPMLRAPLCITHCRLRLLCEDEFL